MRLKSVGKLWRRQPCSPGPRLIWVTWSFVILQEIGRWVGKHTCKGIYSGLFSHILSWGKPYSHQIKLWSVSRDVMTMWKEGRMCFSNCFKIIYEVERWGREGIEVSSLLGDYLNAHNDWGRARLYRGTWSTQVPEASLKWTVCCCWRLHWWKARARTCDTELKSYALT